MIKNINILTITELLSAKIFHDLAGSIGAVANFIEILTDNSNMPHKEAMILLQESSNDILNKFKILRQAYSFSENNLNFYETKQNITEYFNRKNITIEWEIENLQIIDSSLIEKINKTITNLAILSMMFMIEGKNITILLINNHCESSIKVTFYAKRIEMNQEIINVLLNKKNHHLTTKSIHAFFLILLIKHYNGKISYHENKDCQNSSTDSLTFNVSF